MTRTQHSADVSVIARRLREARLNVGISQKNLGIQAGIDEFSSSTRVNQYERGKHVPDFQTLEKFGSILHVPTAFFYARDDVTAEMLLLFANLPRSQQNRALSYLKKLGQKGVG
ncbi:MAG: helix-turn-helix transcriptional regulator [Patescibacteria group bacterium]